MRTIRTGRTVSRTTLSPVQIAERRTTGFHHDDRDSFLEWFTKARIAELRGRDTWWAWRDLIEQGDSVGIAGWIEGVAAARAEGARP